MYKLHPPDPRVLYNRLKSSAKKRGIDFDLTVLDLYEISYPITCPISGVALHWYTSQQPNSYSFDRIDSNKGYSIDNLIVVSWRANRLKSDATHEELKQLHDFYNVISPTSY